MRCPQKNSARALTECLTLVRERRGPTGLVSDLVSKEQTGELRLNWSRHHVDHALKSLLAVASCWFNPPVCLFIVNSMSTCTGTLAQGLPVAILLCLANVGRCLVQLPLGCTGLNFRIQGSLSQIAVLVP